MALRKALHLPHTLACRDDAKAIAVLLTETPLAETPAGTLIGDMLAQRTSECRDLFALRGVKTRRATLLIMAARGLARDTDAVTAADAVSGMQGRELLRLVAALVERKLAPQSLWKFADPAQPAPQVQAKPKVAAKRPTLRLLLPPAQTLGQFADADELALTPLAA